MTNKSLVIRERKSLSKLISLNIPISYQGDARRASWNFQLETELFIYISFNKDIDGFKILRSSICEFCIEIVW